LRHIPSQRRQRPPQGAVVRFLVGGGVDPRLGRFAESIAFQVAVAARVFIQVFLVVFLRPAVIGQRRAFDGRRSAQAAAQRLERGGDDGQVAFVGVIDAGPVLRAPVVALPVDRKRVDRLVVQFQQKIERQDRGVVNHAHRFGMAGTQPAHLLVGRVFRFAVGITRFGVEDAANRSEVFFHPPETAARQINLRHIHAPFYLPNPSH